MNLLSNTRIRLACLAGVAMLGMLLGGCAGDDDGGKKSGGGTAYPAVPTDRPTFTGLSPVIDTHGGDGSTGNNGGSGGDIELRALHGRVLHNDNRSRPAVNANVLTTADLADNIVTYAELLALTGANVQVVTVGGNTIVDLFGGDFFIPGGATLDLSGAPFGIDEVAIRANLAGDVIRIDGAINGVRLTDDSVSVSLLSETSTGTAICVDGNVDLRGYPSAVLYDGGNFTAFAFSGAVVVRGTINTSGNSPSADDGGDGGDVTLASDEGDVVAPFGILLTSGGFGDTGGDGGNVEVQASDTERLDFDWAVRAAGGAATAQGGNGGDLFVNYDGPLNAFCIFECFAGAATSGGGQFGGDVYFTGLTTQGVVQGSTNGGNGSTGGSAGNITVDGESVFGIAVEVTANGGTGGTNNGGDAGSISVYCEGAALVNVLVNAQARGGTGATSGGSGGRVDVGGYGETNNLTATADASGGNGGTGNGGAGGETSFYMASAYGESIVNSTFTAVMNGGNGVQGGQGGSFRRFGGSVGFSGGQRHNFTLNVTGNGGNGTSASGGAGGTAQMSLADLVSVTVALNAAFNGGATATSTSGTGTGGSFLVNMNDQNSLTLNGGTVSLRGGLNSGSAAGGLGGRVDFQGQFGAVLTTNNLTWDLRGGDSNGGRGGDALNQTNAAFTVSNVGQVLLNGGAINAVGGQGSVTSGSSGGGNGGRVTINAAARVLIATPVTTSGGTGSTNGAAGGAGPVFIAGNGALIDITANITANGQTGTTAGAAGNISIVGVASSNITISAVVETRGGTSTSIAGPVGAVGGNIDIGQGIEAAFTLTATGVLRSVGGGPNANSGLIDIDLTGTGLAGIDEQTGSQIIAQSGNATAQPANIDRNTN